MKRRCKIDKGWSQAEKKAETQMDDPLTSYRQHLVLAAQKAQEDYDKAVISLSGGALGVSFVFLEKIIGDQPPAYPKLLVAAWICWAASIASVMTSYFLSRLALRKAIRDVDADRINSGRPGGSLAVATEAFNVLSGFFFIGGVISMSKFVLENMRI